ncbi:MAG: hypothetical protein BWY91_02700 [bacterium ADurb.BinA028]|nr:MAG: hypothetical protein BWY91_02700 [bacterium ADurb.BinA028]
MRDTAADTFVSASDPRLTQKECLPSGSRERRAERKPNSRRQLVMDWPLPSRMPLAESQSVRAFKLTASSVMSGLVESSRASRIATAMGVDAAPTISLR